MNPSTRPSLLAVGLNLAGAVAVGVAIVRTHTGDHPVWVLIVALAAVLAWALRSVLAFAGLPRLDTIATLLAAALGAFAAAPTQGLAIIPAAIALVVLVADTERSVATGATVLGAELLLVIAGALVFATGVQSLLAELASLLVAGFAGLSRRQFRRALQQEALLRERELEMREEVSRISIARDLHDVLAHSLGGLVIQLDAVDALLEAGETAPAHARVVEARALAASGLSEARRAVAALREPGGAPTGTVAPDAFATAIDDLLSAHRSLGGTVDLDSAGEARPVGAEVAAALQRALQESLSNARKHAPGAPALVRLDWEDDSVRMTVSTPVIAPPGRTRTTGDLAASGGGHGLEGMRERFAALPLGGRATAGVDGDAFTVVAEARLP